MSIRALSSHPRDHVATIVVAALSSAFGVVMLEASGIIATAVGTDEVVSGSTTVRLVLSVVTSVFTLIAVYVGAIVTANTFATIIAGRTRQIALLRLIGAQAGRLRRAVATEGLLVGVMGAIVGLVIGAAIAAAAIASGTSAGWLPSADYVVMEPLILLPVAVVAVTTWASAWVGSRAVTTVTPLAAVGAAVDARLESARRGVARNIAAITLAGAGFALLALGVVIGLSTPIGLLVSFFGGVLSFTGIVLGAHLVMPPVLRLVGRAFGPRPAARLAAENAVRFPERSSRATIGLVIGVTLVTMFAVAMASYRAMILSSIDDPTMARAVDQSLTVTTAIFAGLVGFSAIIAAVGMINNLSLSVLQRTRELGLLRALGFTSRQVRGMILTESAQMTVAAVLLGLVLGVFYGWAAAQSILGSLTHGIIAPALPWPIIAIVVIGGAALSLAASVAPSRRATTVSPVVALTVQ
ncbi:FtsX-like permease family protein [Glaciibacter flavus]|uniref:FtsX-like permease family protein n=1 Tax=Orlajensenia flava TaxID=2565934 RepID=A0A4S4FXM7_9MICO|nr:ABC transporter permease [Glaciibacter flavus]THG35168.1 FtsX-like permease family protein [Glaciibacter flavus]